MFQTVPVTVIGDKTEVGGMVRQLQLVGPVVGPMVVLVAVVVVLVPWPWPWPWVSEKVVP